MVRMSTSPILVVKSKSECLFLELNDILYVEADGNYCNIFFADGSVLNALSYQRAEIARMMQEQVPEVWERDFAFLGRSFLINLKYVMRIQPTRRRLTFKTNLFDSNRKVCIMATADSLNTLLSIMEERAMK